MKHLLITAGLLLLFSCSSKRSYSSISQCEKHIKPARAKAVHFLVNNQHPSGSWGDPGKTKGLNIYCPGPNAHLSYRVATTALCIMALTEEVESPGVKKALKKSLRYVFKVYPYVKRADSRWVGNNWTHAYLIRAMIRVRPLFPELKSEIDKCLKSQVKALHTYAYLNGGWGYYDFKYQTRISSGSSTAFTTATCLIALHEAEKAGFKSSPVLLKKAFYSLIKQRNVDNTFFYSDGFWKSPKNKINTKEGSCGRTQGCLLALYLWNKDKVTQDTLNEGLDMLVRFERWLDIGRKKPRPHESFFAVAGYFYYYGHFYGSEALINSKGNREKQLLYLSKTIVDRQERNGLWFDFSLYNYGDFYGTAFGLMSLQNYQKVIDDLKS